MLSPRAPASTVKSRRRWVAVRLVLRGALWLLLAAWTVLALAWLALHWFILPHINDWRPTVERHASAALGVQVRIGHIQVRSSGWVPALELYDLKLLDPQGREALHLQQVSTALSPKSLIALQPRFAQLHIEGASLDVRRDAQGHIHVAGLDMSQPGPKGDTTAVDWFFEQEEFVIRNGSVRWTDELRQAEPLQLGEVDLVLRNSLRRHAMRLDATPPPQWGERFSLRGRFSRPLWARAGDFSRWGGTLYAELPRSDVSELRRHVNLPFELSEGDGALRAWVEVAQGLPQQFTLDLALRAVTLRLARNIEPLSVAQVHGRVELQRKADGVTLSARQFGFTTGEGQVWPAGQLQLTWKQKQDLSGIDPTLHPVTGGEFSAERLDVHLLAELAERLPLGDAVRKLLQALAPKGVLQGLSASWGGPLDAPTTYQVRSRLSGLSIEAAKVQAAVQPGQRPVAARPGFKGADIDLQATEAGGEARLAMADGALAFPGVLEQPVVLQRLAASLAWRITPAREPGRLPHVELKVKEARFANADAQGELSATWSTGAGTGVAKGGRFPGQLDLQAQLAKGHATRVANYLPLGIPQPVRDYVRHAVLSGTVNTAALRVRGDLWEFPFHKASDGEFNIKAQVQDVGFAFIPSVPGWESPWPAFTRASGELEFDRLSMKLSGAQARMLGFEFRDVHGGIADLSARPVVNLEGIGRGPAADVLRFIDTTPVGQWLQGAVKPISANGQAELKLALAIPVAEPGRTTVKGSVTLAGSELRIRPDLPLLAQARGRLDFTERGFAVVGASARVAGGEAQFDGGSQADGSLRFNAQGLATAEGLRRLGEFPVVVQAAQPLRGQAAYRLQLGLVKGHTELLLTSPMVGMEIDLPAPLRKAAEGTLPLKVQTQLVPGSLAAGQAARDQLQVELGTVAQAQYLRDVSGEAPVVLRGAVGVLDAMPPPVPGVQASLNLPRLNIDEWQAALPRLGLGDEPGAGAGAGSPMPYLPQTLALRAGELQAGSRRLDQVVASLSQHQAGGATTWRAKLQAQQLSGTVEWHQPHDAAAPQRLVARLARLSLPPADVAAVEALIDAAPGQLPALDIVVEDFELRGRKFGRLEVQAAPRAVSGRATPREWHLSRLALTTPEAQLQASGQWVGAAGSRHMDVGFKLDLGDSGQFVERLGAGKALRGGKGQVSGKLRWAGSPFSLDFPSLQGQMRVELASGQFLNAEPGAARLLGILSLQSLPRRLLLDFRDVFQEGFAFDNVTGDLSVAAGVASTRNLRMRGVQATVFIDGAADIQRETQDLQVLIVPEVNAGAASLAYAAVNPAIGLGTFVAQLVLRRPLMLAGMREFHVTGPWAEPKVERVEREGATLPVDTPASPPSPSAPKPPNLPASTATP